MRDWNARFGTWLAEGRITFPHTVVEGGVATLPQAMIDLLSGRLSGTALVRVVLSMSTAQGPVLSAGRSTARTDPPAAARPAVHAVARAGHHPPGRPAGPEPPTRPGDRVMDPACGLRGRGSGGPGPQREDWCSTP
ncbi:hypothetical protein LT493_11995 [Streptomyces tricolor]|nr:hypothetical protein [Streptomyces tricolor]